MIAHMTFPPFIHYGGTTMQDQAAWENLQLISSDYEIPKCSPLWYLGRENHARMIKH